MGKTCPEDGVYRDVERPAVAPVAHSVQRRFRALRREASLRGLLVTLTVDEYRDIIAVGACHYCGCELAGLGSGLDRMDPLVGYTPENVVTACASCNKAKLTHDYATWKRIADAFVEKHDRGTMWPVAPRTTTTERRARASEAKAICELAKGVQALALWAAIISAPDGDRSTSFRECDPDALEARRRKRLADEAAAKESAELATDASVLWRKWQRLLPTGAFLWRGEWRVPQSSSD